MIYWNNLPAPYAVERLNAVMRRGNVDLRVWFTERTHPDRSWSVDESEFEFPFRYLRDPAVARLDSWRSEMRALRELRSWPDLLVSLYAAPIYLAGWSLARAWGVRTGFRVLPTYDTWVRRHLAKEAAKRFMLSRVDAVKVPGPDGAAYARRYGVRPERIHYVTQTIDVDRFRREREKWLSRRADLRVKLGVDGCVFLYVGRLVDEKGIPTLLEAQKLVAASGSRVSLVLVGDGRDEEKYRQERGRRGLTQVRFVGFVQPRDLHRIYAACDVFVFPTIGDPNGVVVEEAMASSLPVVTSSAAGDIRDRVRDGCSGFVVPPGDSARLAQRMTELAEDVDLRRQLGSAAAEQVAARGHSRYALDFERFVYAVLDAPEAERG